MKPLLITLMLMFTAISISAQPAPRVAYIQEQHGKRIVTLILKRDTAERLKAHQDTDADREELRSARALALGYSEPQGKLRCIGHDTPHDISRWLPCSAMNIRRSQ